MLDFRTVGGVAVDAAALGGLEVEGKIESLAGSEGRKDGEVDVGGYEPPVGKGKGIGVDDRPQGNRIMENPLVVLGVTGDEEKVGRDVAGFWEAEVEADGIDGEGDARGAGRQWGWREERDAT